jgi:penicillin-insensitive murein endopeptidase
VAEPSAGEARAIGSYAKGCLSGAAALPVDGPTWQVMRLSRNRHWGHPTLVSYIETLANDVAAKDGLRGLLIGDMSQPRGGPMASGHASHQVGLDVDIWLAQMPDHTLSADEREKMGARSVLRAGKLEIDPALWSGAYGRLIRRAVSYPEVERVFVSAAIKLQLCQDAGANTAWLRKVRPWAGHDDHIHVRLRCPPGQAGCADQAEPPPGDGCGAELAEWFKPKPPPEEPPPGPIRPVRPKPPLSLADLPAACSGVLTSGLEPGQADAALAGVPLPRARPAMN